MDDERFTKGFQNQLIAKSYPLTTELPVALWDTFCIIPINKWNCFRLAAGDSR